jgi:hypothetical protein
LSGGPADPFRRSQRQAAMSTLELVSLIVAALMLIVLLGTLAPDN